MATTTYPRAEVASAYAFHMFGLAAELAARNSLAQLYCAMPHRLVHGVPRSLVKSRIYLSGARWAAGRLHARSDKWLNRRVAHDFGSWVARSPRSGNILHTLSSFAPEAQESRRSECLGIVDRGSWHIVEQAKVIEQEVEKYGLPGPTFDDWIVERELRDYAAADVIFVPSLPALTSFFRQGTPSERLAVIPYGVDLRGFSPGPEVSRDRPVVITVGKVSLQKGHHRVLRAISDLSVRASFRFIGPVDREFVRAFGQISSAVALVGQVARGAVATELRNADIFVLASVQEGLAQVVLQAMACGLPVVVTEATGAAAFVEHGVQGFVVGSEPAAIAEALDYLLRNEDARRQMGQAARRRACDELGSASYAERVLAEYSRRLSERDAA